MVSFFPKGYYKKEALKMKNRFFAFDIKNPVYLKDILNEFYLFLQYLILLIE